MKTLAVLRAPLAALLVAGVLVMGGWQIATPAHAAASISMAQSTVPQGSALRLSGAGFTPSDTVVVYFDASENGHAQRIQTSVTSNGDGTFAARLVVPSTTFPTTYMLWAKDTHGVSASQHILVRAVLVLRADGSNSATTVLGEHQVIVNALGFNAGELVTIQATFPNYSGNDIVATKTPTANASGSVFGVTFAVPGGTKLGWSTVSATGQQSKKPAHGHIYVTYRPYIYLRSTSVAAGNSAGVEGRGFVSNSQVHVQITINTSNGSQTLTVRALTNAYGNFTKYVKIPGYANAGTYTVTAIGTLSGIKRTTKLGIFTKAQPKPTATSAPKPTATSAPKPSATLAPKPTATSKPSPHYNGVVRVFPHITLPNQNVAVAGTGYPGNTTVNVTITVGLRGGGNRYIQKTTTTDSGGRFTVSFRVPYKAAQGTYAINARGGGQQASDQLRILPLSAKPANLNFQWVSLWYHTVRQGTYDVITIQSTLHIELGIWAHVIFPGGQHWDFYKGTDSNGQWSVKFTIPHGSVTAQSNHAYITLQLWHGSQTTQSFIDFTLV